jgi:hypothetical protein
MSKNRFYLVRLDPYTGDPYLDHLHPINPIQNRRKEIVYDGVVWLKN